MEQNQQVNGLEQDTIHTTSGSPADEQQVARLLQGVWDRVHQAGELIKELRTQRSDLVRRLEALESEISRMKGDLANRNEIIKTLTEQQTAAETAQGKGFTNGERDAIAARVKELLARIDSYL